MGVGKTTLAKKISNRLNLELVDLDRLIEKETNSSINDFFDKWGETFFRDVESSVLRKIISQKDNFVLSCGGGVPCFKNNIELMNDSGISILIEMPPEAIFSRIENAKNPRPLLKNLKGDDLLKKIETLLAEREKYYEQASIKINGLNYDMATLINQIKEI